MTSSVTKGHLKISNSSFSTIYFLLTPNIFKNFQECQHYEDTIFVKLYIILKGHFYVMERFCDYFTLRFNDLITTLNYVLMETFVHVLTITNLLNI